MGYVLNLQTKSPAGGDATEPASIWSTASVGGVCAISTVSVSACLGGSTFSAVVCM